MEFQYNPKYPSVERDLAMVVPKSMQYNEVKERLTKLKLSKLQDIRLFDIFENEKLVVYQVKGPQSEKTIGKRGPLLLQVLAGSGVGVIDIATKQRSAINAGSHFYMQPGSSFYLDGLQSDDANIILIEIK